MKISSSSLFHHTKKLSSLKSILENQKFKVQYSSEKIFVNGNASLKIAVPMVSFCDIPLTYYKTYLRKKQNKNPKRFLFGYYGDYGIGLKKEWAIKNGIYPVIYIPRVNKSDIKNNSIVKLFNNFAFKENITSEKLGNIFEDCPQIVAFCKNYKGKLEIKYDSDEVKEVDYSFYDDREWRYVPSNIPIRWNFYNSIKETSGVKNKKLENNNLKESLQFSVFDDVSSIIVKNDSEIPQITKMLDKFKDKESAFQESKTQIENKFQVICSKIVTTEQIRTDF